MLVAAKLRRMGIEGQKLLDLGCGNGRDTVYLNKRTGSCFVGLDACPAAVEAAKTLAEHHDVNCNFIRADACAAADIYAGVQGVYSRFFFHSISCSVQHDILELLQANLREPACLYIEVRAASKAAAGHVETNDGHYRRLIHAETFFEELHVAGFDVVWTECGRGLARFGNDDPVILRIHAVRRKK